jgi:hypothetical protein
MAALSIATSFFGLKHTNASKDIPNHTSFLPSPRSPKSTSHDNNKHDINNNSSTQTVSLPSIQIRSMYEAKNQKRAFVSLCKRNRKLLQSSKVFDGHALAMAFIYLQRLNIKPYDYNDDLLYCALYMAVATEEDSEEGVHELLVHRVGVSVDFPELDYTDVKRRCLYDNHEDWRKELHKFYAKVNQFWKALDYRTFIPAQQVATTQASLAAESSLFAPRQQSDIDRLAPFW